MYFSQFVNPTDDGASNITDGATSASDDCSTRLDATARLRLVGLPAALPLIVEAVA